MSHSIEAAEYIVGDEDEWREAVNYQRWSEKHTFYAGDVLVFNYVPGLHNTYEVNEDTYRSCNTSQGVIATYYSGHDQVTLNETGDHWFLCNIQDHCKGGMKFGVKVEAIMNTSQMTSGSMGFTTTSIGGWRWVWTFDLVPLLGLFMLNY
ncbi:Blue copper protein [Cinnamomum micranthum f. kanehirae]|uniref:Blue copper protein n=1 Tax=Cinnamomum micranthum f. kanehirae TaxID=337451 RepID=A0A3S3NHH1_9MAGN|nr:Blue copper protein [Cinnamomum micranthum f. kanehirae]